MPTTTNDTVLTSSGQTAAQIRAFGDNAASDGLKLKEHAYAIAEKIEEAGSKMAHDIGYYLKQCSEATLLLTEQGKVLTEIPDIPAVKIDDQPNMEHSMAAVEESLKALKQ